LLLAALIELIYDDDGELAAEKMAAPLENTAVYFTWTAVRPPFMCFAWDWNQALGSLPRRRSVISNEIFREARAHWA
jgi:hypothetical protein